MQRSRSVAPITLLTFVVLLIGSCAIDEKVITLYGGVFKGLLGAGFEFSTDCLGAIDCDQVTLTLNNLCAPGFDKEPMKFVRSFSAFGSMFAASVISSCPNMQKLQEHNPLVDSTLRLCLTDEKHVKSFIVLANSSMFFVASKQACLLYQSDIPNMGIKLGEAMKVYSSILLPSEKPCQSNLDCQAPFVRYFCQHPVGKCAEKGKCLVVPGGCRGMGENSSPVCGCDGSTYQNECLAKQNGVSLKYGSTCVNDKR